MKMVDITDTGTNVCVWDRKQYGCGVCIFVDSCVHVSSSHEKQVLHVGAIRHKGTQGGGARLSVFLSLSIQSKIGCEFGDSTARNITASSGKLRHTKHVYEFAHTHRNTHPVDLSFLNDFLNATRGRDRWCLFLRYPQKWAYLSF